MSAKHTPGPWNVSAYAPNEVNALDGIFDAESNQIGMTFKGGHHLSMQAQRANARLIAAAPELLAALMDAMEQAQHADGCRWFDAPIASLGTPEGRAAAEAKCNCWRKDARAAISKATGSGA